jgi:hypothetical protein
MSNEEKLNNCLMVIQVPLKDNPDYKPRPKPRSALFLGSNSFNYSSEEGDECDDFNEESFSYRG